MTLAFDLEGQSNILFSMIDYVKIHVKINFVRLIFCEISWLKCICILTVTFDIKVKFTFWSRLNVLVHTNRIKYPWSIICEISWFSALSYDLNLISLEGQGIIFIPWPFFWCTNQSHLPKVNFWWKLCAVALWPCPLTLKVKVTIITLVHKAEMFWSW